MDEHELKRIQELFVVMGERTLSEDEQNQLEKWIDTIKEGWWRSTAKQAYHFLNGMGDIRGRIDKLIHINNVQHNTGLITTETYQANLQAFYDIQEHLLKINGETRRIFVRSVELHLELETMEEKIDHFESMIKVESEFTEEE